MRLCPIIRIQLLRGNSGGFFCCHRSGKDVIELHTHTLRAIWQTQQFCRITHRDKCHEAIHFWTDGKNTGQGKALESWYNASW